MSATTLGIGALTLSRCSAVSDASSAAQVQSAQSAAPNGLRAEPILNPVERTDVVTASVEPIVQPEVAPALVPGTYVQVGDKKLSVEWQGIVQRLSYENGQVADECAYVNGRRQGLNQSWHSNGQLHSTGEWRDGNRCGVWAYFSDGGTVVARGEYRDGYREGFWETWRSDGSVESRGKYVQQMKEGEWLFYFADGSIKESESGRYEHDEKVEH